MTAVTGPARLRLALVLLAIASGATDAFAFLLLGGIFTANMTGNLVLLGLYPRSAWLTTAGGAVTAIVFFAGAVYAGFRTTRARTPSTGDGRRPLRAIALVGVVLQLAVAVAWPTVQGGTSLLVDCAFIATSAAALGLQTVLAKRISGAAGLTTTFVTGTLTSLMQELAERSSGSRTLQALIVASLAGGAVVGAATVTLAPAWAPTPALVLSAVAVVLLFAHRARAVPAGAEPGAPRPA
ncbi:hypothetical protein C5C52_10030 [Rathayibacter sp. AY1E5]|nr:hypothetical protein C5C52_10030 [Rathayibacter sp. AY1E5]